MGLFWMFGVDVMDLGCLIGDGFWTVGWLVGLILSTSSFGGNVPLIVVSFGTDLLLDLLFIRVALF